MRRTLTVQGARHNDRWPVRALTGPFHLGGDGMETITAERLEIILREELAAEGLHESRIRVRRLDDPKVPYNWDVSWTTEQR